MYRFIVIYFQTSSTDFVRESVIVVLLLVCPLSNHVLSFEF